MNNRGFTLVEVIIAMAIVGVMVVTFIPLLTAQYINIHKTGDQSSATYDAVEKAEEDILEINKDEADRDDSKINGKVDDTEKVEIDLGREKIEIPVDTITVTGEADRETEKTELIVGVPRKD